MDNLGIDRIAHLVAKHVWSKTGPAGANVSSVRNALASADREHFVPAVLEAIRKGWVHRQPASDLLYPRNPPPGSHRNRLVAELDAAQQACASSDAPLDSST